MNQKNRLEVLFERTLFGCRHFVLIAVIGLALGAILMFLKGGVAMFNGTLEFVGELSHFGEGAHGHSAMLLYFIAGVDNFLFGLVLLIFSLGIYELFVSPIDHLEDNDDRPSWLHINSLEDLKGYLGKVILIILIVGFFEHSFHMKFETALELLTLAGGIALIALSLYLSHAHQD